MKTFYDVVYSLDADLTGPIVDTVGTCRPGPVPTVLAEIGNKVPELTTPLQAEIEQQLAAHPRPVTELDTSRVVKETYKIGDITITGPIAEIRRLVKKERTSEGVWRLTIESHEEPIPVRQ